MPPPPDKRHRREKEWVSNAYKETMGMGDDALKRLEAAKDGPAGSSSGQAAAASSSSSSDARQQAPAPEPTARHEKQLDEDEQMLALAKVRAVYYVLHSTPAAFEPQRHTSYILGRPVQAIRQHRARLRPRPPRPN